MALRPLWWWWDILLAAVTVVTAETVSSRCRPNTSWWSADAAVEEEVVDCSAWLNSQFRQRYHRLYSRSMIPMMMGPRCSVIHKRDSRNQCHLPHRYSAVSVDCDWHLLDSFRDALDSDVLSNSCLGQMCDRKCCTQMWCLPCGCECESQIDSLT